MVIKLHELLEESDRCRVRLNVYQKDEKHSASGPLLNTKQYIELQRQIWELQVKNHKVA